MPEWLDRITAKTDLMRKLSSESALHGKQRRYAAPDTRTILLAGEFSFLQSGGSNDDNEHTGEDDLF